MGEAYYKEWINQMWCQVSEANVAGSRVELMRDLLFSLGIQGVLQEFENWLTVEKGLK